MINIRINGTIFDTQETIAATIAASEIGKLETKQGSTTNQFSLPYTAELAAVLGFPDQININTLSPYRKIVGELLDDNQILSFGYFQINEIADNKVSLTFYGDNSDWFSEIKDFKLTEIDLSDIDHAYSEANIVGSWNNTWSDGYVYPIIDYGRSFSLANTEVTDWYPATFLRYILLRGFEDKGFKFDGDLLNDDLFNKIIIPFSKKDFINATELIQASTIATRTAQSINTAIETKVDWNLKDDGITGFDIVTNDRFTAPSDGVYTVEFSQRLLSVVLLDKSYELRVKLNGTLIETFLQPNPAGNDFTFNMQYSLTAGDYLEWYAYHTEGSARDFSFSVKIDYENRIYEGATIQMKYTLPDIEFADLLRWVGFTFGVVFTYDPYSKTISFNKFSQIPFNTQVDWTEKLIKVTRYDFTEAIERYPKTSRAQYLHTDDDILLLTYKNITGFNFGDGVITVNNEFNTEDRVIYEAPFAGTITARRPSGGYLPWIQRYSSTDKGVLEPDVDPKPRVLILHADDGLNFSPYASIDVGSTTSETSCAYATFFKADHSSATIDSYNRSLAYATPQIANPNDDVIFESPYWDRYLKIFANPRIIEAEMFLSKADIATLDFTRPVFIDSLSALFYINKVKDYRGEGTTLVELVKL